MKRLRYEHGCLDKLDAEILGRLLLDARTSIAELARQVGLTPPSVAERVRRLEEAGVIESYATIVNPQAIGLPVSAYLRTRPVPGKLKKVTEILTGLEAIVRCDRVTGEDCFFSKAHVESIADLEKLTDKLSPYAMTNTSIIQSTPISYRMAAFPISE